MRHASVFVWLVTCGVMGGGCGEADFTKTDAYARLGQAQEIVSTSLQWMGGYEAWKEVRKIQASALVTVYGPSGQLYVNRQRQVIDIHGGTLVAEADTGQGSWRAVVRDSGRCRLRAKGFRPEEGAEQRICGALRTLLHRVRGPLNLLRLSEKVVSVQRTRLGGQDVVAVAVQAEPRRADGYYFQATSGELRYVSAGVDEPGAGRTLTTYRYMMLPSGMAFPKHIRLTEAGPNVPVSRRPVLDVEFEDVRIR